MSDRLLRQALFAGLIMAAVFILISIMNASPVFAHGAIDDGHFKSASSESFAEVKLPLDDKTTLSNKRLMKLTIAEQMPGMVKLIIRSDGSKQIIIDRANNIVLTVVDEETSEVFYRTIMPISAEQHSAMLYLKPSERFSVTAEIREADTGIVLDSATKRFSNHLEQPTLGEQLPSMITLLLVSVGGLFTGRGLFYKRRSSIMKTGT